MRDSVANAETPERHELNRTRGCTTAARQPTDRSYAIRYITKKFVLFRVLVLSGNGIRTLSWRAVRSVLFSRVFRRLHPTSGEFCTRRN